jgi:hypothetical protein
MLSVSAVGAFRKLCAKQCPIVIVVAVGFLAMPMSASATTATASVRLSQTSISVGAAALGKVNVHMKFASVESVCFAFTFTDDLLDPGDELVITPLRALPSLTGPAFFNPGTTPEAERTLCLTSALQPDLVSLFADGKEDQLEIAMRTGSVQIARLDVTVEGVPR